MNKREKKTGKERIAFWIGQADGEEIIDLGKPVKVKPK